MNESQCIELFRLLSRNGEYISKNDLLGLYSEIGMGVEKEDLNSTIQKFSSEVDRDYINYTDFKALIRESLVDNDSEEELAEIFKNVAKENEDITLEEMKELIAEFGNGFSDADIETLIREKGMNKAEIDYDSFKKFLK